MLLLVVTSMSLGLSATCLDITWLSSFEPRTEDPWCLETYVVEDPYSGLQCPCLENR